MVPTRALLGLLPMSALVVLPVIASKRVLTELAKEILRTRDPIPPSEETVLAEIADLIFFEKDGTCKHSKGFVDYLHWCDEPRRLSLVISIRLG